MHGGAAIGEARAAEKTLHEAKEDECAVVGYFGGSDRDEDECYECTEVDDRASDSGNLAERAPEEGSDTVC